MIDNIYAWQKVLQCNSRACNFKHDFKHNTNQINRYDLFHCKVSSTASGRAFMVHCLVFLCPWCSLLQILPCLVQRPASFSTVLLNITSCRVLYYMRMLYTGLVMFSCDGIPAGRVFIVVCSFISLDSVHLASTNGLGLQTRLCIPWTKIRSSSSCRGLHGRMCCTVLSCSGYLTLQYDDLKMG